MRYEHQHDVRHMAVHHGDTSLASQGTSVVGWNVQNDNRAAIHFVSVVTISLLTRPS